MGDYVLGESTGETERLVTQAARDDLEQRLEWAGLKPGMVAIDAGCGPGETTRKLSSLVGLAGRVSGFDVSAARVEAAQAGLAQIGLTQPKSAPTDFSVGDIYNPPLAEKSADFVLCQWVLEYLSEPQRAVAALIRLLRPGGILLLCDADSMFLGNWPAPETVERGTDMLFATLAQTGFDPYVGRKMYRYARDAGLTHLDAMLYPCYVIPGEAPEEELLAWRQRFTAIAPLGERTFGDREAYQAFVDAYLNMLVDPGVFKYTAAIAVRGIAP